MQVGKEGTTRPSSRQDPDPRVSSLPGGGARDGECYGRHPTKAPTKISEEETPKNRYLPTTQHRKEVVSALLNNKADIAPLNVITTPTTSFKCKGLVDSEKETPSDLSSPLAGSVDRHEDVLRWTRRSQRH